MLMRIDGGDAVLSLVVSTIAYFVASYGIKRQLDDIDVPKSMTRSILIFCAALMIAYMVAAAVDWLFP
jgi:hypothetical protein